MCRKPNVAGTHALNDLLSVWRLEPGGAEGQLESMAAGNIMMVPPAVRKAQVQSHVILHNSNSNRLEWQFAALPTLHSTGRKRPRSTASVRTASVARARAVRRSEREPGPRALARSILSCCPRNHPAHPATKPRLLATSTAHVTLSGFRYLDRRRRTGCNDPRRSVAVLSLLPAISTACGPSSGGRQPTTYMHS
jgi:hypothetical protein